MKQTDGAYLSMFVMVYQYMMKNKLTWQDNQLIVYYVNQLDADIKAIRAANQGLSDKPSYITKEKKKLRKSLNIQAFNVKEGLRIYYSLNDMTEDMQMFTFAITKFLRMTDGNFYMEASHILERAEALATELSPIGITAVKIANFKADLLKFYNKSPEREFSTKKHKALVKFIPVKVKETRLMLKRSLDALVGMYAFNEDKMFVALYKSARHINAKPGRHKYYSVLLKGRATDAETQKALSDVEVEAGAKKKKVITDAEGYFKVRVYTKDADILKFSKPGYEDLIINIPEKHINHEIIVNAEMNVDLAI